MDNSSRLKIFIAAATFMCVSVTAVLISTHDYISFITRSEVITFSTKNGCLIWFSPLCMYFSLLLFKYILTKKQVVFNNKTGGIFGFMAVIGFVFSLFLSFYVDFKLKSENYITCAKSSWIAPNKYVKDVSLCK
ncbi:DUF1240 domain-containing protein [Xenorhabdus griffiniae]|uniref:DUF1240 domain-containing protein n=1 Tax=Xenorhabdus griffiniae TaxID=351672 RepID=UPI0023598134|nr:DUF1240 domain-containing protein [Xenorhabdus griffiniae]MDC9605299.1 DUF1240 domain-containing protein [Xenorhabdus griffiniae]